MYTRYIPVRHSSTGNVQYEVEVPARHALLLKGFAGGEGSTPLAGRPTRPTQPAHFKDGDGYDERGSRVAPPSQPRASIA